MYINMPVINDLETTKKIREINKSTPLIAVTVYTENNIYQSSLPRSQYERLAYKTF